VVEAGVLLNQAPLEIPLETEAMERLLQFQVHQLPTQAVVVAAHQLDLLDRGEQAVVVVVLLVLWDRVLQAQVEPPILEEAAVEHKAVGLELPH